MALLLDAVHPALSVTTTLYVTLVADAFVFVGLTVIEAEFSGVSPDEVPEGTDCAIH